MKRNRAKVQKFLLEYIKKIGGVMNHDLYRDSVFGVMDDDDFHDFMVKLRSNDITLSIIAPNGMNEHITVKNAFKIGKELGYEFFQHLAISGDRDMPEYVTPNKYLIYKLPIKRPSQLLTKGIALPESDKFMDLTTGQVTGPSRVTKISMPETQMLIAMGLNESVKELLVARGGDLGAKNAMMKSLQATGKVNAETIERYSTGVESAKTLDSYLKASHILPEGLVKK